MFQLTLQPNQKCQLVDDGTKVVAIASRTSQGETLSISTEPFHIHIPADTTLEYFLDWQKQSVDREVVIHLDGEGATAKLTGLFFGDGEVQFKLNSTMIHHAPNTYGNTLIKGALKDASRATLKGLIKIDKGANGSDDLLTERVLLLSPKARAEADPMLEIDANEVKATHAASISRINREQMYYLQARGIGKETAQQLIVEGFLEEVKALMPNLT